MRRRSWIVLICVGAMLAVGRIASASLPVDGDEEKSGRASEWDPANPNDSYNQMIAALGHELYANQLDLMSFGTWLLDRTETASSGFHEMVAEFNARRIILLWSYALPSLHDPFLQSITAEAERRNIELELLSVPYSAAELTTAAEFALAPENAALFGFTVRYVEGPTLDAPYLTIAGDIGLADTSSLSSLAQQLLKVNVPVVVRGDDPIVPFSEE